MFYALDWHRTLLPELEDVVEGVGSDGDDESYDIPSSVLMKVFEKSALNLLVVISGPGSPQVSLEFFGPGGMYRTQRSDVRLLQATPI